MSARETGLPVSARPPRSRELAAALATAVLLAHLVLAQLTLAIAVLVTALARLTRWRPYWLTLPAGVGLALVATGGLRAALTGFAAWPQYLAGLLADRGARAGGLAGLLAVAGRDLPRQLPLALLAGPAEAGVLLWLTRGEPSWRPGLIAALRGRHVTAALAAGRTVTAEGWAVGFDPGTGRRACLGWAQAERGVLACGPDAEAVLRVCLPAGCAALRRRKALIITDLSGGPDLPGAARALAGSLGRSITDLDAPLEQLPAALGQALQRREPVLACGPASVASLTSVLTSLRDLRLRTDALAWIHGCERADPAVLRALIAVGGQAGCGVLLSTADHATARELSAAVGTVLAVGPIGSELAAHFGLAPGRQGRGQALAAQASGSFAIVADRELRAGLAVVPIRSARP